MSRDMVPISIRDPFFKDPFFSSTWEEFDKMRTDMMAKSKDFWGKVDSDFANFEEQVKKSHSEMDSQMSPFRPQLPGWAIPDSLRTELTPFQGLSGAGGSANEVIKVKQDDGKFEVTLDVSDYKPEELKVTTVNNVLSIGGKHEAHAEDSKDHKIDKIMRPSTNGRLRCAVLCRGGAYKLFKTCIEDCLDNRPIRI